MYQFKRIISLSALCLPISLILITRIYMRDLLKIATPNTLYVVTFMTVFLALSSFLHLYVKARNFGKKYVTEQDNLRMYRDLSHVYFVATTLILIAIALYTTTINTRYLLSAMLPIVTSVSLVLVLLRRIQKSTYLAVTVGYSLTLVALTHVLYVPVLGYDTWRDVIWGELIRRRVNVLYHLYPYPIPLVPLLYSMTSELLGSSTLEVSALLGIVYLNLMVLLIYVSAKYMSKSSTIPLLSIPLVLSSSPITFLSTWFVPQAYSAIFATILIMFLIKYLYLNSHTRIKEDTLLMCIIIIITVTGHVLNALLVSVLIGSLLIKLVCKLRHHRDFNSLRSYLRRIFLILVVTSITYIVYTAVINAITVGAHSALRELMNVLLGYKYGEEFITEGGDPLLSALLGYGPLIIYIALSFLAWVEEDESRGDVFVEAAFPLGIGMLALGILSIHAPYLFPQRYFTLIPTILLMLASIRGFDHLHTKGYVGKVVSSFYIALIVSSFVLGIVHIEDDTPISVRTAFTISAPLRLDETLSLNEILPRVKATEIRTLCTDGRASSWVQWYYIRNQRVISMDFQTRPSKTSLTTELIRLDIIQLGAYETHLLIVDDVDIKIASGHVVTLLRGLYIHRLRSSTLGILEKNLSEIELLRFLYNRSHKVLSGPVKIFLISDYAPH